VILVIFYFIMEKSPVPNFDHFEYSLKLRFFAMSQPIT
jgi:hypothetical protein